MQRDSRHHCRRVTWEASRTTLTESRACEFLFSRPPETRSYYFGQGECKRAGICCLCFFFSLDVVMIVERECICTNGRLCVARSAECAAAETVFFAPSAIISELNGIEKRQGKNCDSAAAGCPLCECVFAVLHSDKSINAAPRFGCAYSKVYCAGIRARSFGERWKN